MKRDYREDLEKTALYLNEKLADLAAGKGIVSKPSATDR